MPFLVSTSCRLGERRWNLETSSTVVEILSPYRVEGFSYVHHTVYGLSVNEGIQIPMYAKHVAEIGENRDELRIVLHRGPLMDPDYCRTNPDNGWQVQENNRHSLSLKNKVTVKRKVPAKTWNWYKLHNQKEIAPNSQDGGKQALNTGFTKILGSFIRCNW